MNDQKTIIQWWEKQKNKGWKSLISPLKKSKKLKDKFDDFIKNFYWLFRKKKGISEKSYPEISFLGFKEFEEHYQRAGYCQTDFSQEITTSYINKKKTGETVQIYGKLSIFLNQWYLLDKLGMSWLVKNDPRVEIIYIDVSFDNMIKTIAHEIAHAYQETVNQFKWGETRSQCESSGDKLKYPELVAEHTLLTKEIKQLIINSSKYQEFKKWWISTPTNSLDEEEKDSNETTPTNDGKKCETCGQDSHHKHCEKCDKKQKQQQLDYLISLISNSKDLATLKNNYRIAKNNPLYKNNRENKKKLNDLYNSTKYQLSSSYPTFPTKKNNNNWVQFSVILIITVLDLILFYKIFKRKKKTHFKKVRKK